MSGNINILDDRSRLILHRTSRDEIKKGITVIEKGEGVRLVDKEGNRYLDMEAGITRPVHIGYGRQEVARAAYDQCAPFTIFLPADMAMNLPWNWRTGWPKSRRMPSIVLLLNVPVRRRLIPP